MQQQTNKTAIMDNNLSFENLPNAVGLINEKVEQLKTLVLALTATEQTQEDKLIRPKEAAIFLDMAKATLYSKVSRKEVPFMKRGGQLWFSTKDLSNWIRSGKPKEELVSPHTFIKARNK